MLELKCGFLYSKSESRRAPSETAEPVAQADSPHRRCFAVYRRFGTFRALRSTLPLSSALGA
jgi:hypothetical protein